MTAEVTDGATGATTHSPPIFGRLDVELISPANERQIYRAMPSFESTLIHDTPDMYQNTGKNTCIPGTET